MSREEIRIMATPVTTAFVPLAGFGIRYSGFFRH